MISGSMTFVHDMVRLEEKLKKLGHTVCLPIGMEPHFTDPMFVDNLDENLAFCIEDDIMVKNFKQIEDQEALLVFNKKKNNSDGYMGISTLMECAIAKYLGKKIFIMFDLPSFNTHRWAHEVTIMQPVMLHGNLKNLK